MSRMSAEQAKSRAVESLARAERSHAERKEMELEMVREDARKSILNVPLRKIYRPTLTLKK